MSKRTIPAREDWIVDGVDWYPRWGIEWLDEGGKVHFREIPGAFDKALEMLQERYDEEDEV